MQCSSFTRLKLKNYDANSLSPTDGNLRFLSMVCQHGIFQIDFQMFSALTRPKKAQLRAPLSPLQTAWTGFNPNLYSGGSSSAGPALVEIATARSFILNRGIVTDTMTATPWSQDGLQCIPLHQGCCHPGWCPANRLAGLWGLTVKAQCLSAYRATQAPQQPLAQLPTKGVRAENIWHQCPSHWQTLFSDRLLVMSFGVKFCVSRNMTMAFSPCGYLPLYHVIIQHVKASWLYYSFQLLSNDYGFLNIGPPHFDQRTRDCQVPLDPQQVRC